MAAAANGTSDPGSYCRHVLVMITGGTICMQDSPDGLIPTRDFVQNCLQPSDDFNDGSETSYASVIDEHGGQATAITLQPPPRPPNSPKYKYSVLEFSSLIDSSSMDGSHWNQIVKCLTKNWISFDAFVILHGTDTLAYTASALSFMLGDIDKTVVVTGSQLSMYAPKNDAHDNLLDSLTVAANYDVPEVSVVFHHHLYRGTRVTKVSAFSMAAFTTPNAKPLASFSRNDGQTAWSATVHSKNIKSAGQDDRRSSAANHLLTPASNLESSGAILETSQVAVLKVYPGISANLISSIVQIPKLGGLVLETFGAGNIPLGTGSQGLLQILSEAVNKGIVVVSVTQCLTGSVTSAYESARRMERLGIVTGLDMTTEAAYTKLTYLLSRYDLSPGEVAKKMRQDLRGELTADYREGQRRRDSVSFEKAAGP